ncbi:MAG: acyltransferase domain-containing protein [Candidatus Lindowbacteria bacterium]|nr:acyltransferase domain-containing protein [Candidatus Lindowbacteria bacterium]
MSCTTAWVFGGQGSQTYGMGAELYEKMPSFRKHMNTLSEEVADRIGVFLPELLYSSERRRSELFKRTLHTHPAIFILQYSIGAALIEEGEKPDLLLGYSLGEFVAAALSGMLPVKEVLDCVILQAELLENSCEPGGMTAFLGSVNHWEDLNIEGDGVWLAGVNHAKHFAVSGTLDGLKHTEKLLSAQGLTPCRLPVEFAFHSPMIEITKTPFIEAAHRLSFAKGHTDVFFSSTVSRCNTISPDGIWHTTRNPVRFQETMETLIAEKEQVYLDFSPAGSMTNLIRYGFQNSTPPSIYKFFCPFGHDFAELQKTKEALARIRR